MVHSEGKLQAKGGEEGKSGISYRQITGRRRKERNGIMVYKDAGYKSKKRIGREGRGGECWCIGGKLQKHTQDRKERRGEEGIIQGRNIHRQKRGIGRVES